MREAGQIGAWRRARRMLSGPLRRVGTSGPTAMMLNPARLL